jgi:hypothetical protein
MSLVILRRVNIFQPTLTVHKKINMQVRRVLHMASVRVLPE